MHHHHQRDESWHFNRRGFGPFGRGFGPFGPDVRGGRGGNYFRAGKMIADGDLRIIVLALLAERPRHGYDIIKALEELSSGIYSPSPGVIYPTLTYLEEVGYAGAESEGNKKVYSITDSGRAHLAENRELANTALSGIEKIGKKIAKAREWFNSSDQGRPGRGDRDIDGVLPEVNQARKALKQAIAEAMDGGPDEQRRVARILAHAAEAISKQARPRPEDAEVDL